MDTTQVIDELAKRFGTTAEYLVKELARYNITVDIVGIVLSMLIAIVCALLTYKIMKNAERDAFGDYKVDDGIILVLAGIGCLVCIIVFLVNLVDCIGWIVSPTAGAINCIMR